MPYIKQEKRPPMDEIVNKMVGLKVDSHDLSYVLFNFCRDHVELKYNVVKNFIAELNESVAELKRRFGLTCSIRESQNDGVIKWFIAAPRVVELDELIELMVTNDVKVDGDLNYVIFKYIRYFVNEEDSGKTISLLLDTIEAIRDNLLGPYEDEKLEENGDV